MSATREQIESFYRFASSRVKDEGDVTSIDELFRIWRAEEERADCIAKLKKAYAELEAGETVSAREMLREARERLGVDSLR
ncbi:MAG: hypothetical protein O2955_13110 [Planctomycetota bacterium]|nr:hypothetical protein [Planctomycetota bacterium]MDA1213449.1 hypothetical protein [Planctomycetota bacterium]